MNMPEPLNALCIRLAITLAHFLWQGAAVALAAGLACLALRKAAPAVRYRVLLSALAIMAACPVVTLLLVPAPASVSRSAAAPAPALPRDGAAPVAPQPRPIVLPSGPGLYRDAGPLPAPLPAAGGVEAPPAPLPTQEPSAESLWQWLSPYAAGAYAFGVLVMFARLLAGLHGGRRLRRGSEPVTDPALLAMLARQARALGLRLTPAIACCGRVAVPIVVGLVRPMILLPMSMSAGLSPGQVEAVLAHELAHIRRLDPLVNVVQRLIESLLFYHPGVWFISRRIRVERENCCDDLAVAAGAERLAYAESLLHIAQRSLAESRAARGRAPVGVGATDKPSLLRTRIRRLLGGPEEPVRLGRTWPLATLLVAAVVAATALLNLRADTAGIADPNASASAAKDRPPATKPAQPGEFIHRVYDVRDLIVPVPDFPGPEYWDIFDPNAVIGSPADKLRAQWREAEAKKLMDRLIEQIKGIDPESWKDEGPAEKRGNIQLLNGVLVISQTRANHGWIEKLIAALRSKKSMQVLVGTRFIDGLSVPAGAKEDALSAWLGKNVKARLDEKTGLLPLSADQARSLIELVSGPNRGIDVKLLTAPRITLSNKQRAYVVVCRGEATLLPSLDKDGNTVLVGIPTGACLDIKPTIDPDYKSIACQLHAWSAEKASDGKTPIMVVQAETKADFRVPDKGAMLLRMERVKHVVDGARQVTDPNGVVKVEVRHKPVETSGQAKEYVYVLLQPEIVVNEAAETTEAGVPSLKSQPAPATQPADAAGQDQWPAPLDEKWLAGAWLLKASEPSRDGPSYCLLIMTPDHKWARASIWGDPAKPEKVELTDHGDKWETERPDLYGYEGFPGLMLWTRIDPADPRHRTGHPMGTVVRAGPTRLICEHFISITVRNSYTRCDKATWEALSKALAGTAAPQFKTYPKPPATEWPGRPDESRLVGSWLSIGLGITPPALLILRADHSWVRASVTGDPRKPSKVSVYSRGRRWSYSSDEQYFTDGLTLAEPLDSSSVSITGIAQLGSSKLRLGGGRPYERLDAALAASLDKAVADNPAVQVATQTAKEALILLLDHAREAATRPADQAADVAAWREFLQRTDLTPQMRFYAYWMIGRRYSYNVDVQRGEKRDHEKAAAALEASLRACGDFVTWETVNAATTYGSLAVEPNKDARRAAEAYNWLCSRTDAMLAYSADNTDATFPDGMILGLEYFPGYRNRAADRTARLTFLRDRLAEGRAAMTAWISGWVASARERGTSERLQAVRVLLAELSDSVPAEDKAKWKAMLEAKAAAAGANPAAKPATEPMAPAHKPGTVGPGGVLRISVGDLFDKGKGIVVEREVSESGTIWLPVLDKPVKVSDANQQEIQGIIAKAYAAASMKDLPIAVTILRPAGTTRPLAPGDIIEIVVHDAAQGMENIHRRQIQPDGTVEVPGLKDGTKAAGLTTEGFEKSLSRQLGKRAEVRLYISADFAPGDIIDVSVVGLFNEGLETVLRRQIGKDGTIDLPNIRDRVRAAGMLPQALSKAISKLYDGKDAAVSVVTKNYKPARPPAAAKPAEDLWYLREAYWGPVMTASLGAGQFINLYSGRVYPPIGIDLGAADKVYLWQKAGITALAIGVDREKGEGLFYRLSALYDPAAPVYVHQVDDSIWKAVAGEAAFPETIESTDASDFHPKTQEYPATFVFCMGGAYGIMRVTEPDGGKPGVRVQWRWMQGRPPTFATLPPPTAEQAKLRAQLMSQVETTNEQLSEAAKKFGPGDARAGKLRMELIERLEQLQPADRLFVQIEEGGIAALIKQLGSTDARLRSQAQQELRRRNEAYSVPALQAAQHVKDPQTAQLAKAALAEIEAWKSRVVEPSQSFVVRAYGKDTWIEHVEKVDANGLLEWSRPVKVSGLTWKQFGEVLLRENFTPNYRLTEPSIVLWQEDGRAGSTAESASSPPKPTPATQPASATTEPKDVHAAVRIEAAKVMLDQAKAKLADVQKAVEDHSASDNDLARAQREVALDELGVKLAEAEARGDRAEDAKLRVQAAAVDKQYKDRILANVEKAAKSGAAGEGELEEARLDAKIAEFGLLLAKAHQAGDAVEVQRLRVQAAQVSLADKQRKLARVEALQKRNVATKDQVLDARTDVKIAELSLRDEQASLDEVQKRALPATQPADAATSQSYHATAKDVPPRNNVVATMPRREGPQSLLTVPVTPSGIRSSIRTMPGSR